MMPFGGLFSLAVLIIVIGIGFALFRGGGSRNRGERSPALNALEERYAKGDIQRDEYLQKKTDLGG